jgi:hypothetical protein
MHSNFQQEQNKCFLSENHQFVRRLGPWAAFPQACAEYVQSFAVQGAQARFGQVMSDRFPPNRAGVFRTNGPADLKQIILRDVREDGF